MFINTMSSLSLKVRQMRLRYIICIAALALSMDSVAQIGEHRNDFAIGVNAGYTMSNI